VNSATNAVLLLNVQFWQDIAFIDGSFGKIPNGGLLNDVLLQESLHGLVLWTASGAVGATDRLDVATSVLVTSIVSSFLGHDWY